MVFLKFCLCSPGSFRATLFEFFQKLLIIMFKETRSTSQNCTFFRFFRTLCGGGEWGKGGWNWPKSEGETPNSNLQRSRFTLHRRCTLLAASHEHECSNADFVTCWRILVNAWFFMAAIMYFVHEDIGNVSCHPWEENFLFTPKESFLILCAQISKH